MFKCIKNRLFTGKRQSLAALVFGLIAALLLPPATALAGSQWQDHKQLYTIASDYIQRTTGKQASIKPLNVNNRIPHCIGEISADFPFNNQKTLRLRCDQTNANNKPTWSIHLKVNLATQLQVWRANQSLAAGQLISATDFSLQTYQGHDFGQFVKADLPPVGRYTNSAIKTGSWLKNDHLSSAIQVWTTRKAIPAETTITEVMISSNKVNRRQTSANAVTNKNLIIGKTARRNLAAGHTVTSNDLTGKQQVLIAAQNLPPNRPIVATDLKLVWMLDTKIRQPGYQDKNLIMGKVPRSYIASGRMISENLLRTPHLIAKGATVKLIFKTANLSISSEAKALADGNLGDIIEVEVLGSKKLKQGKVIAKGVVELVE